jgi:hypothetical protein
LIDDTVQATRRDGTDFIVAAVVFQPGSMLMATGIVDMLADAPNAAE